MSTYNSLFTNVGVVADISASVDWLKENGSKKVGMVGYCMGSALTIACSARFCFHPFLTLKLMWAF
ncbi:hypothetical protein CICLE_v10030258mg [Citrus x clementina]|uniref:Dienelactone hydrolase domain-containing protein n=1 Tax=Citrus clementina TaxID=85681 RepID=V4SE98_CITCL|nr:hypothetical protein CICLE_v10030258mg [Citrus x clementina]